MMHFRLSQLVDYGRGLTTEPEWVHIDTHLAEGCRDCSALVSFFRDLAETCADGAREVPPLSVTMAKAIFSGKHRKPADRSQLVPSLNSIMARLIRDSFAAENFGLPLAAGVRSVQPLSRELMFEALPFRLFVKVEPDRDSTRLTLVGQVSDERAPSEPCRGVPVVLQAGRRVVAETVSNEFGEFYVDCPPQKGLRLRVTLSEKGYEVLAPLSCLTPESGR